MFKWHLVGAVVAGLILAGSGSTVVAGVQDQVQISTKKTQLQQQYIKYQQQKYSKFQQQQYIKYQQQKFAKSKRQSQDQSQQVIKPIQQFGKGKGKGQVIIGQKKRPKVQPQFQPQFQPQPQLMPQ